jgi:alanine dehydrogenase
MPLVLGQEDVRRLLPMDECIEAMEGAFRALAGGGAVLPLRSVVWMPDGSGGLGLMPAYHPVPLEAGAGRGLLAVKAVTFFPGNRETEFDSHQGVVLLFDSERGSLVAIVEATEITSIRTAAASALATRILAREDAGDLAIFGSSTQARVHLEAMALVRNLRRVRIWSRHGDHARAFARTQSSRPGPAVEVCASAREAAEGADILCTVTSAREPFLRGEWVAPGAHINAVGSSVPAQVELFPSAVARSRMFGDWRAGTLAQAGDFLLARKEGAVSDGHVVGDLADLVARRVAGRRSPEEVTLFKSLGLAVEDIAAASLVCRKAAAEGAGVSLALGGRRRDSIGP